MSDQPPKPKPGSLRDRIAAFEKGSTTVAAPGPTPPATRPKPGGISWKPRAPTPPESPSASADASFERSTGGMSASDAKESIVKGGSLKERMAALQGRGAFGAPTPPPVAPKPAVDKPKWKPPPVIKPVDKDDDDRDGPEQPKSPPPPIRKVTSPASDDQAVEERSEEAVTLAAAEGEEEPQTEPDPAEEERQRRAAIAARMARLGGARVGMAPVFGGARQTTKKSEPVEDAVLPGIPKEEIKESEEAASTAASGDTTVISSEKLSDEPSSTPGEPPLHKKPEPSLSTDSDASLARTPPTSMPLPNAPRRAGPPRKKVPKSPEIPPPPVMAEGLVGSPEAAPALEERGILEEAAVVADSEEKTSERDEQEAVGGINDVEIDALAPDAPADEYEMKELEVEEPLNDEAEDEHDVRKKSVEVEETTEELAEPSSSMEIEDHDDSGVEEQPEEQKAAHEDDAVLKVSEPIAQTVDELEEDEDEEVARRRRIAEKLAKMGGVNPFAPPPQRKGSASSEGVQSPSNLTKRASVSSRGSIDSTPPVPPQRKESVRKSSLGPTMPREEVVASPTNSPPTLAKRTSVSSRDSIGSLPPMPPQRKASIQKSFLETTPQREEVASPTTEPEIDLEEPAAPPSTRKSTMQSIEPEINTLDLKLSETDEGSKSEDDGWQGHRGTEPATGIPEEDAENSDYSYDEEVPASDSEREILDTENSPKDVEELEYVDDDELSYVESETLAPLPPPPPPPPPILNLATRPKPPTTTLPVDLALPVDPIQHIDARAPPVHTTSPSRSLKAPPRRYIPQPIETGADDESDGYHFSPSPRGPTTPLSQSQSQEPSGDEGEDGQDEEPLRRLPHRTVTEDDERPPLPVPNRTSSSSSYDFERARSVVGSGSGKSKSERRESVRPLRSIPPPPPDSDADVEQDSDFGEALPTPPRHRPRTPGTLGNEVPLIVPPPTTEDERRVEPSPLRQSSYPATQRSFSETSPSSLSSASLSDKEVLDDEEGDPIDPSFVPSRRTSVNNALPRAPEPSARSEEDEQAARRHTIAERMARLGGIKFGAMMPPARPPPPPRAQEETSSAPSDDSAPEEAEETPELTEEEEERARKERIQAKLAMMGGMRIGMLPTGVGAARPQPSHPLADQKPAPPPRPPVRAVPPARPPPPPQSPDSDPTDFESSLSASQHSLSTSEEGVKVEAEDSEMEEVSHSDAQEEEAPPPLPLRGSRRRGTEEAEQPTSTSTSPPVRPPVPTSLPRRPSVQSTTSTVRKSSADSGYNAKRSSYMPQSQSEYVMVEDPSGDAPPPPPARLSQRPPQRNVPPPQVPDSISSQWELPSIPSPSLEFGAGAADLSLSWPDNSNPATVLSRSTPAPPPLDNTVAQQQTTPAPAPDRPLSADELMAVWGRVGVQVCEVATTFYDKSKKTLIGDGTYFGFIRAVLSEVPNAAVPVSPASSYGYLTYSQTGHAVQKRASEIMPGDVLVLQDAKLKGHKGLQSYSQTVGVGEQLVGIVSEFEPKKSKVRLFQANQHVGQQTVEAVSYRLEDLKSGTIKVYRVLEG